MRRSHSQCAELLAIKAEERGLLVQAAKFRIEAKRHAKHERAQNIASDIVAAICYLLPAIMVMAPFFAIAIK